MKFEKIIIPPGWQESFTKYPNGKTIFEALSTTITTVNEGIEEVNQKVNQGLVAIEQAENIIRDEITDSFNTLKLELESEIGDLSADLLSQWASFQLSVNAQLADIENVQLPLKANRNQEAWITPTLLNGWTGTLQYAKDSLGYIHFIGTLNNGTGVPFVLPVGYRPLIRMYFVYSSLSGGPGNMNINYDGTVTFNTGTGERQLSNITYKGER